jgi:cyclopropane fatty-acyl-phospholipid synthase-like methyltransferase
MPSKTYIGDELEIFAKAENWKRYFSRFITPHLGERILEVGAGIGATTEIFAKHPHQSWLCLEPDATLLAQVEAKIAQGTLPASCRTKNGIVPDLDLSARFDSILYIDVLEHIETDREELAQASRYLDTGGKIIVLSPAYQSLYSPFDKAIGHFRRYDKKNLIKISPPRSKIRLM